MKLILKIVIGLLSTVLIVFLLAGVFVPQVKYNTVISVHASPQETWTKFNDPGQMSNWMPEVLEIDLIRIEPDNVGTEYAMKVESEGGDVRITQRINEYVPNQKVVLHLDAGDMIKTSTYYFTVEESMVVITGNHICEGQSYIFKCIFAYFRPMFKRIDDEHMSQFKEWVERTQEQAI